jgi:hypothetical protein
MDSQAARCEQKIAQAMVLAATKESPGKEMATALAGVLRVVLRWQQEEVFLTAFEAQDEIMTAIEEGLDSLCGSCMMTPPGES